MLFSSAITALITGNSKRLPLLAIHLADSSASNCEHGWVVLEENMNGVSIEL